MVQCSNTGKGKGSSRIIQTSSGAHPTSYLMGTVVFFPGEKWLEGEINHLFKSSNEVKNEGAVP